MTDEQLAGNDDAIEARRLAYFNTLLANKDGRLIYASLRKEVLDEIKKVPADMTASEHAIGCRYLIVFMDMIRKRCGVINELDLVEAESSIAMRYERKKTEPKKDDMYDI